MIRTIFRNYAHVKVAIFIDKACNGVLNFTHDEYDSFKSSMRCTRSNANVTFEDVTDEKPEKATSANIRVRRDRYGRWSKTEEQADE